MKEGGMGPQFFAVFVAASYVGGNHSARRAMEMIDTVKHDIVEKYQNDFMLVTTAAGVREAHRQHKIAALMGLHDAHP
jgi:membrane dipeptidase